MDATPGPGPKKRLRPGLAPGAEVIFLTGALKGTERALDLPLTCIGRAASCELRLDSDGVSPLHCLIVHGPGGFVVRDLDSEAGTTVNGQRVASGPLHDGDVLAVGPLELRLHLPRLAVAPEPGQQFPDSEVEQAAPDREAMRIQVAAVAAQQAALTEEEDRLQQKQATLEQQESQLAEHLEEKRQRLVKLHAQVQEGRATLQRDREAYERHVEKVTGDLSTAERDMLAKRQQAEAERRRALSVQSRLRERFRRHVREDRAAMRQRQHELEDLAQQLDRDNEHLQQERTVLAQACARFNGEIEVGRRRLRDEADQLHQQRAAWQEQRQKEEANLAAWQDDLEQREDDWARGLEALSQERAAFQSRRQTLEREMTGLENRIRNQRRKVAEQQEQVQRLETVLRELRVKAEPQNGAGAPEEAAATLAHSESASRALVVHPYQPEAQARDSAATSLAGASGLRAHEERLAGLEVLAGELSDQRLRLVEHWEQLMLTQHRWQEEQRAGSLELKLLAEGLQEKGLAFLHREKELEEASLELRRRHGEVVQQGQHLVGRQARFRARELAWEGERDRLLLEVRSREQLAERHLAALVDLRQRWLKRRRREMEVVQAERAVCQRLRQQYGALREERRRRNREMESQRNELTARALAVEQYRQECLKNVADTAAAQRRTERLRRRWLTENAAALRALKHEREALEAEVQRLDEQYAEMDTRNAEVWAERAALAERRTAWDHKHVHLEAEEARLRQEVEGLRTQRDRLQAEADELRSEVERIARQLLDEPETPTPLVLDQAA
jgi:hypothetical protein